MGSLYYFYGSRKSLNISINFPIELTENRCLCHCHCHCHGHCHFHWHPSPIFSLISLIVLIETIFSPIFFVGIVMRRPMSVLQFENLQKVLT